jgi:hypothetical protein
MRTQFRHSGLCQVSSIVGLKWMPIAPEKEVEMLSQNKHFEARGALDALERANSLSRTASTEPREADIYVQSSRRA